MDPLIRFINQSFRKKKKEGSKGFLTYTENENQEDEVIRPVAATKKKNQKSKINTTICKTREYVCMYV